MSTEETACDAHDALFSQAFGPQPPAGDPPKPPRSRADLFAALHVERLWRNDPAEPLTPEFFRRPAQPDLMAPAAMVRP